EAVRTLELRQRAADIVREVDGEAGVAGRGILADLMRLEQDDAVLRPVLRQPARRRQPGIAGAHDGPIGPLLAVQRRLRRSRWQDAVPPIGGVIGRQDGDVGHGLSIGRIASSYRSSDPSTPRTSCRPTELPICRTTLLAMASARP